MSKKITPEVKQNRAKWLKALRSGRYKQTRDSLRSADGSKSTYCCLGVLCSISRLGRWNGEEYAISGGESGANDLTGLPSVRSWLAMTRNQEQRAVDMNDGEDKTFEEIADEFENKWRMK